MKSWIIAALSAVSILLLPAVEPVASATLKSGSLTVRLDGRKFDNMNRIEYKGKLFCIDNAGAHYGATAMFQGEKGFVGSGHTETGVTEKILSLALEVDGKPKELKNGETYTGKRIVFRKSSMLKDLKLDYELVLAGDILEESAAASAEKDVPIRFLYFFMHPWSTDFTDLYARNANGKKYQIRFNSGNQFPIRDKVRHAAWYNKTTGDGVVSVSSAKNEGQKDVLRFVWDRPQYRKDYLVDYMNSTFRAGTTARYGMKTMFFEKISPEKWQEHAEDLMKQMEKK